MCSAAKWPLTKEQLDIRNFGELNNPVLNFLRSKSRESGHDLDTTGESQMLVCFGLSFIVTQMLILTDVWAGYV